MKQVSNLSMKFQNCIEPQETIPEEDEISEREIPDATFVVTSNTTTTNITTTTCKVEITQQTNETITKEEEKDENMTQTKEVKFNDNDDVQYEEVDDDDDEEEINFKNPAPFQRTYRRNIPLPKKFHSNENNKDTSADSDKTHQSHSIKNLVRRSIRKLIHPHQKSNENISKETSNEEHVHTGLLSSIRQSFRRKAKPEKFINDIDGVTSHEISILDLDDRRQIFREPSRPQEAKIDLNGDHSKHSKGFAALRSSFRRSTKEAKRQVMRPFTKNETFDFE